MKFSVSRHNTNQNFEPVNVTIFEDFAQHVLYYNYSMGTFKNNDRSNKSFISADAVALDFDGGLSITEAKLRFAQYQHIIAPTRNNQVEKHGVVCDRFRVIIPLEETINNQEDYKETVKQLMKSNPEADPACKDAARMFYPSVSISSLKHTGRAISVRRFVKKEKTKIISVLGEKGKLLPPTLEFLLFGAKAGERNHLLFNTAKDMQGQGYKIEEVTAAVQEMITRTGNWAHDELSDKDLETLENAFKDETNDDLRAEKATFNFRTIGALYDEDLQVDWLVDELLIKGGISLIAAAPKSGKSTIVRQLAKAVCKGESFLGRKTMKGKVAYLALEEHPAMLKRQFNKIGVSGDDDILLHVGPVYNSSATEDLIKFLKDYDAELVVIDTLALFVGLDDINSYDKVNTAMAQVRRIARETGSHVMLVHHTVKTDMTGMNSIMGSQAFLGAVDTAMIIARVRDKRFLTSVGRGLTDFNNCEILFDREQETYTLGVELDTKF